VHLGGVGVTAKSSTMPETRLHGNLRVVPRKLCMNPRRRGVRTGFAVRLLAYQYAY
jgi:hypothetical protein